MKIKLFLTVAFFWFGTFCQSVLAQSVLVPSAPYLAHAPDPSAWTLEPDADSASASPGALHLISLTYTKNGSVLRRVTILSDKTAMTIWYVGPAKYEGPTPDGWVKIDAHTNPDLKNYGGSDFPELDFVSMTNYEKVEQKSGHTCFLYARKEGTTAAPGADQAWIDVKTQLPVAYETGGLLLLFRFLPPPVEKLVVPAGIIALAGRDYKP